jgi:hypothetical protein
MVRARSGGRGTYLAEDVRVDMYRAEALEVGERGWWEREGIRGVCGCMPRTDGSRVSGCESRAAKSGSSLEGAQ